MDKYYTVKELSELSGLSIPQIQNWVRMGYISRYRFGNNIKYSEKDFYRFVDLRLAQETGYRK